MNTNLVGKAANLQKLLEINIPVPKFTVISGTELAAWIKDDCDDIDMIKSKLSTISGSGMISIRSSPATSMPGMMDTILNVPIDDINTIINGICDVYYSYYNKRATLYRSIKNIPDVIPSVILQEMVFGNLNVDSGSGIMFTHNLVGEPKPLIEYRKNVQGNVLVDNEISHDKVDQVPYRIYNELCVIRDKILEEFIYPQDIEFTVENGVLYILQTRRLIFGSMLDYNICHSLYLAGKITKEHLLKDIDIIFDNKEFNYIEEGTHIPISVGIGVVGGLATGNIGEDILLAPLLNNDDIARLNLYKGVITKDGGITSHIAILCRNLNIPYIICNNDITGFITMDGYTGNIYAGNSVTINKLTKEMVCAALMDL